MNSDERLDGDTAPAPRVDAKQFLVFAAIEADPNASSVGWLQARLAELAEGWRSGRSVTMFEPAAFMHTEKPDCVRCAAFPVPAPCRRRPKRPSRPAA